MTDENRITDLMTTLKCTRAEALDIIKTDKEIDQGKRVYFDLDPETEKMAKKMANVGTRKKPTVYDFSKRERKADTTKEGVIQQIYEFLTENGYSEVEILNKSKLIAFKIGSDSYEFDLKRKRKPKT